MEILAAFVGLIGSLFSTIRKYFKLNILCVLTQEDLYGMGSIDLFGNGQWTDPPKIVDWQLNVQVINYEESTVFIQNICIEDKSGLVIYDQPINKSIASNSEINFSISSQSLSSSQLKEIAKIILLINGRKRSISFNRN